jgi:hypothetical protein
MQYKVDSFTTFSPLQGYKTLGHVQLSSAKSVDLFAVSVAGLVLMSIYPKHKCG